MKNLKVISSKFQRPAGLPAAKLLLLHESFKVIVVRPNLNGERAIF